MSTAKICPQCGTEYAAEVRFCSRDGSTLRSQDGGADLVGSVIAERYHVLKKLGEGGMGRVYLAEHVRMGRKSAVKVMHPSMVHDADAIGRFNREASNASQISHPNVASIYDFGESAEGLIYLAMEFVDGEPLTALLAREGPLPPARTAAIIAQTADALAAAHDLGIVHRDLKPDNIMVCRGRDGRDIVKVVDFGIAKAATGEKQNVTKTGLVVGTLEYMSPEQLTGGDLDGRSDLYSLAIVAFTMLTRALPFPASSPQESMIMRLTEQPKRLGEVRPDVAWSLALQAVLDRGLARDVEQRYQSVLDFARELAAAAGVALGTGIGSMATPPAAYPTPPAAPAQGATTAPVPSTRSDGRLGESEVPVAATRPSAKVTAPVASGGGKSALPLVLAAVLLVFAVVGGGGFFLYRKLTARPATTVAQADSADVTPSGGPAANTQSYGATTGAAAGTTVGATSAASPDVAVAPASAAALESLGRYERLIEESTMSRADAREASAAIRKLMPQLTSHDDSTRALKVLALVHQSAGETPEMCAVLASLVKEPSLAEASRSVYESLRSEQCASRARRTRRPAPTGY